jgi:hypothetical protein
VATVDWADVDGRSNQNLTPGKIWSNIEVPRGPGMGNHVAPGQGRMASSKNIWGSMGFKPMTTHQDQAP